MADLLNLTTLIEQPTIAIDGTQYEILHPDQLGILDFQRLTNMAGRVSEILQSDDPSEDQARELTRIIIDLTDRIMGGVPAEVRAKLTESDRLAVAEVFMTLPTTRSTRSREQEQTKAPNGSTGSRRRSGASASTVETHTDG